MGTGQKGTKPVLQESKKITNKGITVKILVRKINTDQWYTVIIKIII